MASSSSNNLTANGLRQREVVTELFAEPRIYNRLFNCCTPATSIRLSWTCKASRDAYKDWSSRAFDVNKHLRRFVKNPTTFRSLLAETGSVIAGSNPLQFFDRVYYPTSDLDLYVYFDSMRSVVKYILHSTGKHYRYAPRPSQKSVLEDEMYQMEKKETDAMKRKQMQEQLRALRSNDTTTNTNVGTRGDPYTYSTRWTKGVLTFESTRSEDAYDLRVQLIITKSSPMQSILSFHSTVVMNAITAYAAYSFYPYATFEEHRAIAFENHSKTIKAALAKYTSRGYTIMEDVFPFERTSKTSPFRTGERWLDDNNSWIIPFSMEGVKLPELGQLGQKMTVDPFAMNSWNFVTSPDVKPKMQWHMLRTRVLKFQYTTVAGFRDFLLPLLMQQGKLELDLPSYELEDPDEWWDFHMPVWLKAYVEDVAHTYSEGDWLNNVFRGLSLRNK